MGKTKIEWVKNQDGSQGYTINPVKGLCPMACSYCYARRLYKRFKWNPEIRYVSRWWAELDSIKPSRIFVGSTMELFLFEDWLEAILNTCQNFPQHTFIFLTKKPQNLAKWSPFPSNTYIGVSVTNQEQYDRAIEYLKNVEAPVKFLSFEPLLSEIKLDLRDLKRAGISWVIIGAQAPRSIKTFPNWEWVREIIDACDIIKIPVFLKNNLGLSKYDSGGFLPYYKRHSSGTMELRQELPK